MKRKLFCELHPYTYQISLVKGRMLRHLKHLLSKKKYSTKKSLTPLTYKVYKHRSLMLRKLGNSDLILQHNKKETLKKVTPLLDSILILPGEVFSFWQIVGLCSKKKGFLEGVTIKSGKVVPGTAGGMCQMTNLIHWMVLHSPLKIIEHHHHNQFDLFPDFNRQIPFGTGTSIMYNYLDYQFENTTDDTFQLMISTNGDYLEGEIRTNNNQKYAYHIIEKNHHFIKENNCYYRCNEIYRKVICKRTGKCLEEIFLLNNKSLVMYDHKKIGEPISS